MGRALIVLVALFLAGPGQAAERRDRSPDWTPEWSEFFKSLDYLGSDGKYHSCCDDGDCRTLSRDEWRNRGDDTYEVLIDGQWVLVPEDKVRRKAWNPTKKAVGCDRYGRVLCFTPYEPKS